jgi:NAD(P)-dependent dehydrogenase (short-subunit alcohol dehydrogenase family)
VNWTTRDISSQSGRRVVITGANSGIGFFAALELARNGAEVIIPARTETKATVAIARIKKEVPNAKLAAAALDLASLKSVRAFAKFYGDNFPGPSLDILINNAGVMAVPQRELTVDGFERQFATNFMGPFALTALLFPHLKPQSGTRIVTLASGVVHSGKIEFDNLQSERRYVPFNGTYSQSKLADLIFALELQRRLAAIGSPIVSIGAHPGLSRTNLLSNMTGILKVIGPIVFRFLGQSAASGALPELFAATSPDVVPGGYYGPNGVNERRGFPAPAKIPSWAFDTNVAKRLWTEAEKLTGVTFAMSSGGKSVTMLSG